MQIQEAYNILEGLKTKTSKKSELKLYEKMLHILSKLQTRTFTPVEMQAIEKELELLQIGAGPKSRRDLKKAYIKLETFLREKFTLTSKGYYTQLGVSLGSCFGILFGVIVFSNMNQSTGIAVGLALGMAIGLTIGRQKDQEVEAMGNLL